MFWAHGDFLNLIFIYISWAHYIILGSLSVGGGLDFPTVGSPWASFYGARGQVVIIGLFWEFLFNLCAADLL